MSARAITALTHLLGLSAFVYPFFLPGDVTGERAAHANDAPFLFSLFGALLIVSAVGEVRARRMDAREIALLGVLAGVNAVLRLPGSFGGASPMFVLPILAGAAFGSRFGFLLGASSMAVSGVLTGGIGPWLPFQMWALGWIGAGGGLVGHAAGGARVSVRVGALAAYGWVAGYGFGALLNLWFWPFTAGSSPLSWTPGMGLGDGLEHYARFYVVSSLAWDSMRAIGNVVLIVSLGKPLLAMFDRVASRLLARWEPESAAPALRATSSMGT